MSRRLFVTGGGGFVGRSLLQALAEHGFDIVALDRSGRISSGSPRITVVRGDLLAPETYRDALAACDTVVHLGAATGKASAQVHHRDTSHATDALIGAAREAGVSRFLFVSSIAVAFPSHRGYPYAQAKAAAERSVSSSGIGYLIVRPTMILGAGAPILGSLSLLAGLPAIVLPGNGRVRVQPIDVRDVVASIVTAIRDDRFSGEVIELGGAETVTMADLLQRIRVKRTGRRGPVMRLPLPLLQVPLGIAESIGLGAVLPVTAGQLTSFRFDGVATTGPLREPTVALDDMFPAPVVAPEDDDTLDAECDTFTRHVIGMAPDEGTRASYRRAVASVPALLPVGAFDRVLLRTAARGLVWARMADAFAGLLARSSTLRKRLVMLLAILESRPGSFERIDAPLGGSPGPALVRMAGRGVLALVALGAGLLIFLPLRLLLPGAPPGRA